MSDSRRILGKWGEETAEKYLINLGYRVIAKNWRIRFGELDLIMLDGDTIVFVEVRTKSSNAFGKGAESIDYFKQKKLMKLATVYLDMTNKWDKHIRFDIISIERANEGEKIEHLKNVFT